MRMRRSLIPLALTTLVLGLPTAPRGLFGQSAPGAGPAAALLSAAERRAAGGDLAGALADYEQLVEQFPESPQAPEAMLRIARGWRSAGDRAAALAAIERMVIRYPGAPQSAGGLVLEGRIRSEHPTAVTDLENARKTLEKAWLLFPRIDYPELAARSAARVLDGQIALRLGRDEEASSSFVEVLEMEPESRWSADAHIGLGLALVRAGDWQAAAESFQDALGIVPATADSRALARRRLSLLDRRLLRPATGVKLWTRARPVVISGAETRRISGVAVDDGRLLVVDSGADQVLALSPDGALEKRWPVPDGEKPSWDRTSGIQVAADDSVFLPDEADKHFRVPGRDRALDGIRAVERGPFGAWFVLAQRSSGVLSFPAADGSGKVLHGGDGDPVDLASDSWDRLYVLEKRGRRVVRIDPRAENQHSTAVDGGWRQAAAVTVDPFGYVHVLDAGGGRIHSYDPAGETIATIGPVLPGGVELRKPEDLAAAGDGRLYIADARAGLIVLE